MIGRSTVQSVERAVKIETPTDARVTIQVQVRPWVIGLGEIPDSETNTLATVMTSSKSQDSIQLLDSSNRGSGDDPFVVELDARDGAFVAFECLDCALAGQPVALDAEPLSKNAFPLQKRSEWSSSECELMVKIRQRGPYIDDVIRVGELFELFDFAWR